MAEKISIITVSYNSENTIERTIRSVLSQSYRPLEYIFVDGGSTDGTCAKIQQYIHKFQDAGIDVCFKSEADRGISDAFNKGIKRSTGGVIGIINSDDALADEALNKVMDEFYGYPDTDVVCGDCLWVDEANGLQYIRKSRMELNKLKYEMVLMHPTCFVKKSAYSMWGGFDTAYKYVMDKELMARFYKMGAKFKYTPNTLAIMYAGGVSDENRKKVAEEGVRVAVANGVPRWKAALRAQISTPISGIIKLFKKNKGLWGIYKKQSK